MEKFEEILKRYKPLVLKLAKGYYLQGGDIEDLIQEGMIALYICISSFDEARGVQFSTYAYICISTRLKNVIRASNSKKNQVLNQAFPLDHVEIQSYMTPEEQYIVKEEMTIFRKQMEKELSPLEFNAIDLLLKGLSRKEISEVLKISLKSLDNAITRGKKKVGGFK